MRRTRARYDLHGAVEGKKNCKAYLRGITPCSETKGAYPRPYQRAGTFDLRVNLLVKQLVRNRLDGGRSKRLTVGCFVFEVFCSGPPLENSQFERKGLNRRTLNVKHLSLHRH